LLQVSGKALSDSDSLAAQVAVDVAADVFVVLSDVDGVFSRPPGSNGAQKIDLFHPSTHFTTGFTVVLVLLSALQSRCCFTVTVGPESESGSGGMDTKVHLLKPSPSL
jgi:glutamate 5-kinase